MFEKAIKREAESAMPTPSRRFAIYSSLSSSPVIACSINGGLATSNIPKKLENIAKML